MTESLPPGDAAFLEYMIKHCYRQLIAAKEHDQQMHWWHRMSHYINQRSPETIMRMERAKGLA